MSNTGYNLLQQVRTWRKQKNNKNWQAVLAAARKHTLSSSEVGRFDDVNGIGLDDESDILALHDVPENKRLEIIANCK